MTFAIRQLIFFVLAEYSIATTLQTASTTALRLVAVPSGATEIYGLEQY